MKLAIIIVNYNVKYYLEQCLHSLRKAVRSIEAVVYVVDNNSQDGSCDYIASRFPEVRLIKCAENRGFAKANNMAISRDDSEYVLLLNPDTIVGESTLTECLAFMDTHEQAGACGVRMLHADGSDAMESRRGLPEPLTAFYTMTGLCRMFPESRRFARYYMSYLSWDKPEKIEVISGAFMLIRRKTLVDVGLLDETFFMYGEDIDYSFRIYKAGWDSWYLPHRILHYKGESTQKTSFRYVHVFYEAMLIFFRKHYGGFSILLSLPIKFAIYIKALSAMFSMLPGKICGKLWDKRGKYEKQSKFLFLVNHDSVDACRTIIEKYGLNASFLKEEPHCFSFENNAEEIFIVCDVTRFSYEDIFEKFSAHPQNNVRIATYNPYTNIIITEKEIFR